MAGHAGESITHLCAARAIQTQLRNSDGRTFKPNGWHGVSACGRQKLSSVRRSVVQRLQRKPRVAAGMDGVHGYKETPHAGFISATLRDAGGLTVADFNAMTNVTVTVELANGKT